MLLYGMAAPPWRFAARVCGSLDWLTPAALKFAGIEAAPIPVYAKISTVAALLLGSVLAAATIDTWTVVRFFGGATFPRRPPPGAIRFSDSRCRSTFSTCRSTRSAALCAGLALLAGSFTG